MQKNNLQETGARVRVLSVIPLIVFTLLLSGCDDEAESNSGDINTSEYHCPVE